LPICVNGLVCSGYHVFRRFRASITRLFSNGAIRAGFATTTHTDRIPSPIPPLGTLRAISAIILSDGIPCNHTLPGPTYLRPPTTPQKPNFEEVILDKKASKIMGGDAVSGGDQHKTS
jgi:hypothetical protein